MARLVFLLVAVASLASAQVYTWTDKDGVAHFTDNPNSVPAHVKAKVTTGDDISTVSLPELKPVAVVIAAPALGAPVPVLAEDPNRAEREWRAAFRDVNERIARLEDEIEADRKQVEDLNGLPVSARYQCLTGYGFGWGAPVLGVVQGGGTSVSVGGTGQGIPGFSVGVGVGVTQTNQVVVANSGVMTTPCILVLNPEFERARERLELNRKALTRARSELADLDRRAGFEAVPREWRR
ncbi:MAG: DUF4124 domain-containing protein [Myxococcales bacterium]|nr:DUF4124 domain-containing protein [Myxococcales bacterium]